MTGRRGVTAAALGLAAVAEVLGIASVAFVLVPVRAGVPSANVTAFEVLFAGIFLVGSPLLGALVAIRRPDNVTGWLFLLFALWMGLGFAADGYVRHAPPDLVARWVAVLGSSLSSLGFASLFLLIMLFPTNRLPSRRWLPLPVLDAAATVLAVVSTLLSPTADITPPIPGMTNPIGRPEWQAVIEGAGGIATTAMVGLVAGSVALLVVRFRRAQGTEREQLKWFVWAAFVFGALVVLAATSDLISPQVSDLIWSVTLSSMVLIPIAAAIAILRYRLFDIDLLIHRTIVYAVLSAVLVGLYSASVLVLSQLLAPLAPGSSLEVAVSTLLVAALFQPARRRVQAAVDRRFYRGRYDAAREIARFAATLRDEVEIDRLQALLAATVERTVQPASASVWLRERGGA